MFTGIRNYLRRRKLLRRDAEFTRQIHKYRREVLGPLGLDDPNWQLRTHKKNRRVYLSAKHAWKIYHSSQAKFGENYIEADEVLRGEDIAAPKLVHTDVSPPTVLKYQFGSLLMEKVEGRPLTLDMNDKELQCFAKFLVRLHSISSLGWEKQRELKPNRFFESYFESDAERELAEIDEWLDRRKQASLPDYTSLLDSLLAKQTLPRKLCFTSCDTQPSNFFLRPNGSICMIDLDLCRFADFPLDLVYYLLLAHGNSLSDGAIDAVQAIEQIENAAGVFLKAYFEAAPSESHFYWEKMKHPYFLRGAIRNLWNRTKQMRPEYNEFLQRDLDDELKKAETDLKIVKILGGQA